MHGMQCFLITLASKWWEHKEGFFFNRPIKRSGQQPNLIIMHEGLIYELTKELTHTMESDL